MAIEKKRGNREAKEARAQGERGGCVEGCRRRGHQSGRLKVTLPDEGSGLAGKGGPPTCPLMRELAVVIASAPSSPTARERRGMIERLAGLEAQALTAEAPLDTLAAIREARVRTRVADLTAWPPVIRGH